MWSSKLGREIQGFLAVLPFGLFVFALYCFIEWLNFNFIVPAQKKLILEALVVFADSFLLNAIVLLLIPTTLFATEKNVSFPSALFKSFSQLPKIIISYLFLMVLVQSSFEAGQSSPIPAFIVLVFFIWAPYFVAFEQFAEQGQLKEEDDELSQGDPFDEALFVERPKTLFSRKSAWQLGFLRSLEFTSKNASLAISVVFVMWLVRVVPELLISLTMDLNVSFTAVVLQVLAAVVGAIFINMYIINALVRGLEPAQRAEMYHTFSEDSKDKQISFMLGAPNGIRVAFLCLLVIFSTVLWSERRLQVSAFPEGLSLTILEVEKTEKELLLKAEISDPSSKFRWFNPNRFRLLVLDPNENKKEKKMPSKEGENNVEPSSESAPLGSPAEEKAKEEISLEEHSFSALMKMLTEKLDAPARIVAYDEESHVIPVGHYSPRNGPVKVVLAFSLKARVGARDNLLYELSYLNPFGVKQVLVTFSADGIASLNGKVITP